MKTVRKPRTKKMEKTLPLLIGTGAGIALTSLLTLSVGSLTSRQPTPTNQASYANPQLREIRVEERQQRLPGLVENATPTELNTLPLLVQSRQSEMGQLQTPHPLEELSATPPEAPPEVQTEQIPLGFGLDMDTPTAPKPAAEASSEVEPKNTNDNTPPDQPESLEADPREFGVTANEGPNKEYEETLASVQRTLTAVDSDGEKQLIRLKIPVMYQSRTLRIDEEQRALAKTTLAKLKEKKAELKKFRSDIEALLKDWNKVVENSTPSSLLLPESPTLPQNQSKAPLNRSTHPALSPGKNISYETP